MDPDKRFQRALERAKQWTYRTLLQKAATDLQKTIRAESGAWVGYARCVVDGQMTTRLSVLGNCVCVTCGAIHPWKYMHAGHFLSSRRASIVLEETGIHPQCVRCNTYEGGKPREYELYMGSVYGEEVIDTLQQMKNESKTWQTDELVRLRISYADRLKAAVKEMD
jgi:hypothetical protein